MSFRVRRPADKQMVQCYGRISSLIGKQIDEKDRKVTISLSKPCRFGDTVLAQTVEVQPNAQGEFTVWLYPTSGLTPLDNSSPGPYKVSVSKLGLEWNARVPKTDQLFSLIDQDEE